MLRIVVALALPLGVRAGDEMHAAHATKLTPENFDAWVSEAIDNKKTAIIRYAYLLRWAHTYATRALSLRRSAGAQVDGRQ